MLFELLFEKRRETETENRVRQTDLLTGNVVLLSERVQVLDRSNYGCLLAVSKKHCRSVEAWPENGFTLIQSAFRILQCENHQFARETSKGDLG